MAEPLERDGLRVPPHAPGAEAAVLAAMLISQEAMYKAFGTLRPSCFYDRKNRLIAEALQGLFERNETADLVTASEELKRQKKLSDAGGLGYLSSLAENVVAPAHVEEHARIVYEKWVQRRLIGIATRIVQDAYDSSQPVDEMLDKAENLIFEIKESKLRGGFVALKELLVPAMRAIERAKQEGRYITGIRTGFTDLDKWTSGLQRGELVIIAGRPSMGKSSLALNIAIEAAKRSEIKIGIFSLEMTTEMLVERMLCSEARVSVSKLRSGKLDRKDYGNLSDVMGKFHELQVYIDDSPSLTPLELKAKARRLHAEGEVGMFIVDYMQLMDASAGFASQRNRQQEITEISRVLKALAKEINVPVVAISQLSRRPEMREDKKPQLADLRESGAIEQDADLVILIYRPGFYKTSKASKDRKDEKHEEGEGEEVVSEDKIAKIIIAKQRNGPTGEFEMAFLDKYMRFGDITGQRGPEEFGEEEEEAVREEPLD